MLQIYWRARRDPETVRNRQQTPQHREEAERIVARLNRKYPHLVHWLVEEPDGDS